MVATNCRLSTPRCIFQAVRRREAIGLVGLIETFTVCISGVKMLHLIIVNEGIVMAYIRMQQLYCAAYIMLHWLQYNCRCSQT
jgi:hypothetical protein